MPDSPHLEPLVRETSRGDKRSEEKLFGILYKFVYATLRKRWRGVFSEQEIGDIQLDCLEKLIISFRNPEKAEKVIEQGRVLGFVHVVAENTALDYNRKRSRRMKVFVSIDETTGDEENPEWESRLKVATDNSDLSDFVLGGMETTRMLSELDGKYRKIIEERITGLEYEEIAEKNGITVANARQIHKRAIGMLRKKVISKHKNILSLIPASQSALLRRLYTKDDTLTHTHENDAEVTEEEALTTFYMALQDKGMFVLLISFLLGISS
jgi:RNA polymerase sigma factor (sigma-70 family)